MPVYWQQSVLACRLCQSVSLLFWCSCLSQFNADRLPDPPPRRDCDTTAEGGNILEGPVFNRCNFGCPSSLAYFGRTKPTQCLAIPTLLPRRFRLRRLVDNHRVRLCQRSLVLCQGHQKVWIAPMLACSPCERKIAARNTRTVSAGCKLYVKIVSSGTHSKQTASHSNARYLSHEPQLSILQGYQGPLMSRYGSEDSHPEMKGQLVCTSSWNTDQLLHALSLTLCQRR